MALTPRPPRTSLLARTPRPPRISLLRRSLLTSQETSACSHASWPHPTTGASHPSALPPPSPPLPPLLEGLTPQPVELLQKSRGAKWAPWVGRGAPSLRHHLHRHFRYFTAMACGEHANGSVVGSSAAAATAGGTSTAGGTAAATAGGTAVAAAGGTIAGGRPGATTTTAGDALTCLLYKEDVWETWVAGSSSADGLRFGGDTDPALVLPMRWGRARMTHNLAIARRPDTGGYVVAGGQYNRNVVGASDEATATTAAATQRGKGRKRRASATAKAKSAVPNDGIYLLEGTSWRFEQQRPTTTTSMSTTAAPSSSAKSKSPPSPWASCLPLPADGHMSERCSKLTQWSAPRKALSGAHPGCVERRDASRLSWLDAGGACEYDGRLSIAFLAAGAPGGGASASSSSSSAAVASSASPSSAPASSLPSSPSSASPLSASASSASSASSLSPRLKLLLYTRANPSAYGSRFVQVTSSADDGVTWAPFQLINVSGYEPHTGDIYFWAAQATPFAQKARPHFGHDCTSGLLPPDLAKRRAEA